MQYTDEWCDTAVSAAAIQAGCVDLIGTECGCEKHIEIFKEKGIWIEDGTIVPLPGDIILYNWDCQAQPNDGYSDHIGYVESVSGQMITVMEVNRQLSQNEAPAEYYVVQENDTLSEIAKRFATTYLELAAWNGIADPNMIYVGQKIRIR